MYPYPYPTICISVAYPDPRIRLILSDSVPVPSLFSSDSDPNLVLWINIANKVDKMYQVKLKGGKNLETSLNF